MASLLGAGNHGSDIVAIWKRVRPITELRIYDDNHTKYPPLPERLGGRIVIGVNDSELRAEIAERYGHLHGIHPLVDPTALIGENVSLNEGVVVAPFASLLHSVTLGWHVHINYHASMTRCSIGDFSTVAPGAVICGNVSIGVATHIGAGAVVCERTAIGSNVVVAAGAIVPPYSEVPDGTKVIGVWKG